VNSLPKTDCYRTASRLRFEPEPFCAWDQHANHSATEPPSAWERGMKQTICQIHVSSRKKQSSFSPPPYTNTYTVCDNQCKHIMIAIYYAWVVGGGALSDTAIRPSVCPNLGYSHAGCMAQLPRHAGCLQLAGHQRCADCGPVRGRT